MADVVHAYADPWYITAFNGDDVRALATVNGDETTIDYKKIKLLKKLKVKTFKTSLDSNDNIDLIKVLLKLKKLGFHRIFLESGMNLAINFLNRLFSRKSTLGIFFYLIFNNVILSEFQDNIFLMMF